MPGGITLQLQNLEMKLIVLPKMFAFFFSPKGRANTFFIPLFNFFFNALSDKF